MFESIALPALLLLPLLGFIGVPMVRPERVTRGYTLAVMLATLAAAIVLFSAFKGAPDSAFDINLPWIPFLGVNLHFGVDGYNVYLLLLTALLFPVVLAVAWNTEEGRSRLYLGLMLALEACLLGTFLAQNLLVLFVLWEAVLIPAVLMILVFGGPGRRRAAMSFFLYTMAGSVLFLAAVLLLGVESLQQTGRWSFEFDTLYRLQMSPGKQAFVFFAIAIACAVKSPIFPFHSWLPLAYGEASTSGTALMAGVMSKMGAFGFIKLLVPLAPTVAVQFAPLMAGLAAVSILYGAVLALRQTSFKMIVAYASLSHMGYIVLGLFSFQPTGIHGAMFQILSHGLSVAGLFLLLGMLEQRCGPAYLQLEALAVRMPRYAVVTMLFVLASLALPLSSGFTAEFMVLLGSFTQGVADWRAGAGSGMLVATLAAATCVVIGATYMLRFTRALLFGNVASGHGTKLADMKPRETLALLPLLVLILWVGIIPSSLMTKVDPAVNQLARAGQPVKQAAAPAWVQDAAQASGASHGN